MCRGWSPPAGPSPKIVYALGAESALVGCDASSLYPEAATKLPQVRYVRALSAEGVLSLRPTLVLTVPEAGPPEALAQLRASRTPVLTVPADHSLEGVRRKIRAVAQALDREAQGEALIRQYEAMAVARQLAHEGVGVVVVVHDLNLAAYVADEIVLLDRGRITAEGRPEDVLTAERIRAVFGLDVAVTLHPHHGRPCVVPLPPSRPGGEGRRERPMSSPVLRFRLVSR